MTTRRSTTAWLLASLLALLSCAGAPPSAPSRSAALAIAPAPVPVPAPLPALSHSDTYWGVSVEDPFRHLEQVKRADVQQWMRAQADAAQANLQRIPGRQALLERMRTIEAAAGGVVSTTRVTEAGALFFLRRNPGEGQFKLIWRERADAPERVLFDPEIETRQANDGQPRALMDFSPSRDGRLLAYSVQVGGSEIGNLRVMEVATGRQLIEPIDRIRYASVSWLDDGTGFFYGRLVEGFDKLPPERRFGDRTAHFRALDAVGTDRPVLSASRTPELKLPGFASPWLGQVPGQPMALAWIRLGVENNILLAAADLRAAAEGRATWRNWVTAADQVQSASLGERWIYLRSALDAPRYKILRVRADQLDLRQAELVVPQGEGVIAQLAQAADALYFTRREGVNTALYRLPHEGSRTPQRVALPVQGEVEIRAAHHRRPGVVLSLAAWTQAAKPYAYDPASGQVRRLPLAADGPFDTPGNLVAREVMVTSHDGVQVPLSIVSRNDVKLDGSNPTIVYGYGAYGSTEDPFYNPRILAWLERGGIWATAHVRGGGVFGKTWHEAGRKTTKPNTLKDAIAAGEWLVRQGYTRSERMAVFGGSAGGILVGRAITERPDLFAVAVPSVGVMDAVRVETSANGVANVPEFGTVKDEAEFRALLAMSSYHQLKDGTRYPAIMATHGVNDIRVDVWQSSKFVSRALQASSSGKPILLRLEYDAGHGQGSTRAQLQERSADMFSFMLWQMGEPGFQPR
jgi:prolyl oligopeptidase